MGYKKGSFPFKYLDIQIEKSFKEFKSQNPILEKKNGNLERKMFN